MADAGAMAWTLGSLLDEGYSVWAHCNACHHSADLDLASMAERLGREAPGMAWDMEARLRCSACGGKSLNFTYSPGRAPGMGR